MRLHSVTTYENSQISYGKSNGKDFLQKSEKDVDLRASILSSHMIKSCHIDNWFPYINGILTGRQFLLEHKPEI